MKNISNQKSNLIDKIKELAKERRLKADFLIEDIFKDTESIPITIDILGRAKTRVEIGNPPGKAGSMGDAVNWEAILHSEDMVFENLNIVSIDKDFASPLDENELNPFLKREYEDFLTNFYRAILIGIVLAFLAFVFPIALKSGQEFVGWIWPQRPAILSPTQPSQPPSRPVPSQ
ncbi:MAG TPA: hypothetical protein VN890_07505 [Methylocella sp.]|nr:hypothetical protein [Methylocella sp.]